MKLVSVHGDGALHRTWENVRTTADPWCFVIESGYLVREADGQTWSSPYPVIAFFWPNEYYQVFLLLKPEGPEYYCNIITPPKYHWSDKLVQFRDLDLDVYVSGSHIGVLDEDEFHMRKIAYDPAWVKAALAAKDGVVAMAVARVGPFAARVADRWYAEIGSFDNGTPT